MYILVGTRSKENKELWAGNSVCPNCGQQSDYYVYRTVTCPTLFFIPLFSFTSGRALTCESCGYEKALKAKEYKNLRKRQAEMLDSGTYPKEKVYTDCHPEKVGLPWASVKLLLIGLLLLCFITPFFAAYSNSSDFGEMFFVMMFMSPIIIPLGLAFYFSLRRYFILLKMKKAYNTLTRN